MKGISNMVLQRLVIIALALNCVTNLVGSGESPYDDRAIINEMSVLIDQDINTSTEDVVRRLGTETDLREGFKRRFLTDAVEGAEITEDGITQQSMAYIRKIAADPSADESKRLPIIRLNGKTVLNLQNKAEALQAEIDGLWMSKAGWGTCTVVGVVVMGGAAVLMPSRRQDDRAIKGVAIAGGGFITLVGGAKLWSVFNKEGRLATDLQTKKDMKQDWQDVFKVK
jgi:hypothetical protein